MTDNKNKKTTTLVTTLATILITSAVVFPLSTQPAHAMLPTVTIDNTGAGCVAIGANWNPSSSTCTLVSDVIDKGIVIGGSGITLDGKEFTISGDSTVDGISVSGFTEVTIKNTNIMNFKNGIKFSSVTLSTVEKNTITGSNQNGINLGSSSENVIAKNTLDSNNVAGGALQADILLSSSSDNTVEKNNLSNGRVNGILLQNGSDENTLSKNTMTTVDPTFGGGGIIVIGSVENSIDKNYVTAANKGIGLKDSDDNTVTKNELVENVNFGIEVKGNGNTIAKNNTDGNGGGIFNNSGINDYTKNTCTDDSTPTGLCNPP